MFLLIRLNRLRNTEVKLDLLTCPKAGVDREIHAYEISQPRPSDIIWISPPSFFYGSRMDGFTLSSVFLRTT